MPLDTDRTCFSYTEPDWTRYLQTEGRRIAAQQRLKNPVFLESKQRISVSIQYNSQSHPSSLTGSLRQMGVL